MYVAAAISSCLHACMPRRPKVSRIYHFVIILFKFQLLRAVKVLVPFRVALPRPLTALAGSSTASNCKHTTQAFCALFFVPFDYCAYLHLLLTPPPTPSSHFVDSPILFVFACVCVCVCVFVWPAICLQNTTNAFSCTNRIQICAFPTQTHKHPKECFQCPGKRSTDTLLMLRPYSKSITLAFIIYVAIILEKNYCF